MKQSKLSLNQETLRYLTSAVNGVLQTTPGLGTQGSQSCIELPGGGSCKCFAD